MSNPLEHIHKTRAQKALSLEGIRAEFWQKGVKMKQVLRESLWFLALQGSTSWFGERRVQSVTPWSYDDFQDFRPRFAASSWRGAMAKGIEQGWVLRTLHNGKTGFLLTQKGEAMIRDRFFRFTPSHGLEGGSELKTLVLLKRHGKTTSSRFRQLLPGIWIHPLLGCVTGQWYDSQWVALVQSSGYEVCVLSVNPEKSLPFSLNQWLVEENVPLQRKLFSISKELDVLLVTWRDKKHVTKKDKQRFGSLVVSGLTLFSQNVPGVQPGASLWETSLKVTESILSLERAFRMQKPQE